MYKKVLIANRGEIAVRIARTLRRLGISSIGIYAKPDSNSLHVSSCDTSFFLGNGNLEETYLNISKIVKFAASEGVEAIHPGYGFLSENARFAEQCLDHNIDFIGPSSSVIRLMGKKDEAKRFLNTVAVPTIPGYLGEDQTTQNLINKAREIGFPILIKAVAGGGGKGMRIVRSAEDFSVSLQSAKKEAKNSFGDDKVILEKYIAEARHIEVQIFGDMHGNIIHLNERDCSLQRRHQKIIEESPALNMKAEVREKLGAVAVKVGKVVNYIGAGTVEFLFLKNGQFYFMEMNTRLQVEHGVTEEITGLDLVEWQIRVSGGEALPAQESIQMEGSAVEARIYSEIPLRGFIPSTGKISFLEYPNDVSGLRIDSGVQVGDEISVDYDPMIAKLITRGENSLVALQRMKSALDGFVIFGIENNISFLQKLIHLKISQNVPLESSFIDENINELIVLPDESIMHHALLIACLFEDFDRRTKLREQETTSSDYFSPWVSEENWRLNLIPYRKYKLLFDESEITIKLEYKGDKIFGLVNDDEIMINKVELRESLNVCFNGKETISAKVRGDPNFIWVFLKGSVFRFGRISYDSFEIVDGGGGLRSPLPGFLSAVLVDKDERVKKGQILMIIEAMKMEHQIVAPSDGTVSDVFFSRGDKISEGEQLLSIEVDK